MCVIAAKYIDGVGFVGVKNRDRNYKPVISFKQSFRGGIERLMMKDDITGYMEGLNNKGICILSSATAVKGDEKEAVALARNKKLRQRLSASQLVKKGLSGSGVISPDGSAISKALLSSTLEDAIEVLKDEKPLGNYIVFDKDRCFIIEIDLTEDEKVYAMEQRAEDPEWEHPNPLQRDYDILIKRVPKTSHVIRTNHGEFIQKAGYQKFKGKMIGDLNNEDYVDWMKTNRISSEIRYKTSEKNILKANSVEEMLQAVSDRSNKDPQLNPLRVASYRDKKALRTTGQIILIPSQNKMQYRNIWGIVRSEHQPKVNNHKTDTYLDLLSYTEPIFESFDDIVNSILN